MKRSAGARVGRTVGRAIGAAVLAVASACVPSVPGFDGSFNDSDTPVDSTDDFIDYSKGDGGPRACSNSGQHCNENADCCGSICSLGTHICS